MNHPPKKHTACHRPQSQSHQSRIRICIAALYLAILTMACQAHAATLNPLTAAQVSDIKVTTVVDRELAKVAEPIHMTVTVNAPNDIRVRFPDSLQRMGKFDVVAMHDVLDIPTANGRQFTRHLTLENIHSGKQGIPSFDVAFVDQRNATPVSGFLKTEPREVIISSSLEGQENPIEFRDIKGVVFLDAIPIKSQNWIFWSTGALLGTLALALVLVRARRNFTPREWAIQSLNELEQSGDLFRGNPELVYVTLTDIVRQFVHRQFDLSAPRLTTKEFLHELQSDSRLQETLRQQLGEFLQQADMVKFAGLAPGGEAIQHAVDNARKFVIESDNQTKANHHKQHPPQEDRFKESK